MRTLSRIVLIALSLALPVCTVAAQEADPTLQERMPQSDFRASGLDKLSADELNHLNVWLQAHGEGRKEFVDASGKPVFYKKSSDREKVIAHIDGVFRGWRGKTVFKLDNGQEWQQAESGSLDAGKSTNPGVRINPMIMGSWLMYIDGCGCSVRVDRIK